jgi:ribonuclease BN (tRNA processing enzyme)
MHTPAPGLRLMTFFSYRFSLVKRTIPRYTESLYAERVPMKFRVLGCSGGQLPGHNLSSFLIDDSILIDAGSATAVLSLRAQQRITNILVTHTHLDHVMTLGTLADNLYGKRQTSINLWSTGEVIDGLRKFFFNNQIWPDFTRITGPTQRAPVLKLRKLPQYRSIPVGSHSVTAVGVNHVVPSVAFFVQNGNKTLLHVGDTGPTEKVWSIAQEHANLLAVVLEASFPNRLQEIADRSRHLTARTLAREINKLGEKSVPILVTHLKPEYRREIIADLRSLKNRHLKILKDGDLLRL